MRFALLLALSFWLSCLFAVVSSSLTEGTLRRHLQTDPPTVPIPSKCLVLCPDDTKDCGNGLTVGRNPCDLCEFYQCPIVPSCDALVVCEPGGLLCPDGTVLLRDGCSGCEFPECPEASSCCAIKDKECPQAACCPDGSWACPTRPADGIYRCGGEVVPNNGVPKGQVCQEATCCPPETRPGMNGTPFCADGAYCCPTGEWTCGIGNGFATCVDDATLFMPDGSVCPPEPAGQCCPSDVVLTCLLGIPQCCEVTGDWVCPDESTEPPQYRCGGQTQPYLKGQPCAAPCELDIVCTAEVRQCDDGSFVNPDPCDDCKFPPCPCELDVACTEDAKLCPDGSSLTRDPCNECQFPPCPCEIDIVCPAEVRQCANGSLVSPDPCNDCQFPVCPCELDVLCPTDAKLCPDGSFVKRDPCNDCQFPHCLQTGCCPEEEQYVVECERGGPQCCADGTWACPIGDDANSFSCGEELLQGPLSGKVCAGCPKVCLPAPRQCPQGAVVLPDPNSCCEYPNCPPVMERCCDSTRIPEWCASVACCPSTGEWSCAGVNGEFECNGQTVEGVPQGIACQHPDLCCDPAKMPDGSHGGPICAEGVFCCPTNGEWSCATGNPTVACGVVILFLPDGDVCPKPCNGDCPDDTLTCWNGDVLVRDDCCNFPSCPPRPYRCCDPSDIPECLDGAAACCSTGEWSCPGTAGLYDYECDGQAVEYFPTGEVCQVEEACCDRLDQPGLPGNPKSSVGQSCCPDGNWSGFIGHGQLVPCFGGTALLWNPDGYLCDCPTGCPEDLFTCPDGSVRERDPDLCCAFPSCGKCLEVCTSNIKLCGKGGPNLSRDPCNNCEFPSCPCEIDIACAEDARLCPDGSYVSRNPCNDCQFPPCSQSCEAACDADLKICGNRQELARDPCLGCEFPPCPSTGCCPEDEQFLIDCLLGAPDCCPDGTWVCPTGDDNSYICGAEVLQGPLSGEICGCPEECLPVPRACPQGAVIWPDPNLCCEYPTCPPVLERCCDSKAIPECVDVACCPSTGEWTCGANGEYECNGQTLEGIPQGVACQNSAVCCDPDTKPDETIGGPICTDGAYCCPTNGQWSCSIGNGAVPCAHVTLVLPDGDVCPKPCDGDCPDDTLTCWNGDVLVRDECCLFPPCPPRLVECCDISDMPECPGSSAACCPSGEWSCPGTLGLLDYTCDGEPVEYVPTGQACQVDDACCDPLEQPGLPGNPISFEGHACCPDGTWSGSIGDGQSIPCFGGAALLWNPDGNVCVCPTRCPEDLLTCPDGSTRLRDPTLCCAFSSCQCLEACTADAMMCGSSGPSVSRDPCNNCEFPPCPSCEDACDDDVKVCGDGQELARDPCLGCEFPQCRCETATCPGGPLLCGDGTVFIPDPCQGCVYAPCGAPPDPCSSQVCNDEIKTCPEGNVVARNPCLYCQFDSCGPCPAIACDGDIQRCEDGTFVGRNPCHGCDFFDCEPEAVVVLDDPVNDSPGTPNCQDSCADDALECPDGSFVGRDPCNDCQFPECEGSSHGGSIFGDLRNKHDELRDEEYKDYEDDD